MPLSSRQYPDKDNTWKLQQIARLICHSYRFRGPMPTTTPYLHVLDALQVLRHHTCRLDAIKLEKTSGQGQIRENYAINHSLFTMATLAFNQLASVSFITTFRWHLLIPYTPKLGKVYPTKPSGQKSGFKKRPKMGRFLTNTPPHMARFVPKIVCRKRQH